MNVDVGAQTDVGRSRERNEDGYLTEDPLYAVADGMGGHRAGEVASRMALETIGEVPPDEGPHALPERVRAANRVVHQHSAEDHELEGMGTTLTALVMDGNEARIAHVGDSRAYLFRDGALKLLTEDHTLVQRMVREGKITRDEADHHPQRSILTRALGVDQEVEVDDLTVPLQPGDRILLCTDGLTSMIGEDRIATILGDHPVPQEAADALVAAANEAGGQDNITVVVLDLEGGPSAAPAASPAPSEDETVPDEPDEADEAAAIAPGADDTLVSAPGAIRARDRSADGDWRGGPEERGGRRWLRVVAMVLGALVLIGVAGKLYIDRQWYVGVNEGRVAIFRGVPGEILGLSLSSVVQETEIDAAEASRLAAWSGLEDGISVGDLDEAEELVAQIRQDLEAAEPPSEPPDEQPTATPSPTPSPGGT